MVTEAMVKRKGRKLDLASKRISLSETSVLEHVSPLSSSPCRTQQKLPFLRFSTDLRLGGHTQLSVPLISRQSKQAKRVCSTTMSHMNPQDVGEPSVCV